MISYVIFQRHKLPKNQFIPTSLKNITITGLHGCRVSDDDDNYRDHDDWDDDGDDNEYEFNGDDR